MIQCLKNLFKKPKTPEIITCECGKRWYANDRNRPTNLVPGSLADYKDVCHHWEQMCHGWEKLSDEKGLEVKELKATILGYLLSSQEERQNNEIGKQIQEVFKHVDQVRYSPKIGPFLNASERELDLLSNLSGAMRKLEELTNWKRLEK